MVKKIDVLISYIKQENWHKALQLAAQFPRLGIHKKAICDGYEALVYPKFYTQIGKDVDLLVDNGINALQDRYASYL